ncbi:MAG: hydrogenase nickel incorporation protein HypB [Bryobacterales bacterium]|nr:hydrogenase nickel incorporation protein HypB [Bryobacteraceae bacterium]MDW8353256.1 hydrogenase nickel incorporation protein HypB [Bryobacterales bacterium]
MTRVPLEKKVLSENDRIARRLRERFRAHGVLCLNLISSPGAGKTSLLERTLEGFAPEERVAVLTGDIQTDNDARRLARYGFPVRQITTGGTCHLEAAMIERALEGWGSEAVDLLFIENVGNLVCPASYDLGEAAKIVLLSVTEGDDKPLKYPAIFFRSALLVLNKVDLLPYVPFDVAAVRQNARRINPAIEILEVSCTTGEGLEGWRRWLALQREAVRKQAELGATLA